MNEHPSRDEFDHLRTRVDILEREVEGEKTVTRYILEQTRRNGDDLAAIRTRVDRVEAKVDGLDRKVDSLDRSVKDLIKGLPAMIADVMRDVHRELNRKN
jgi:uncharacterized protein YoxC